MKKICIDCGKNSRSNWFSLTKLCGPCYKKARAGLTAGQIVYTKFCSKHEVTPLLFLKMEKDVNGPKCRCCADGFIATVKAADRLNHKKCTNYPCFGFFSKDKEFEIQPFHLMHRLRMDRFKGTSVNPYLDPEALIE